MLKIGNQSVVLQGINRVNSFITVVNSKIQLTESFIYLITIKDVVDLAWSRDNTYLASCGLDNLVFIWDGNKFGKELFCIQYVKFIIDVSVIHLILQKGCIN